MWRNERTPSECEHSEMGGHAGPALYGPHSATTIRHHCAPHLNLVLHTRVVGIQLTDADCTLAALRAVDEMALANERTRHNAAPEQCIGDRHMEGLLMAVVALTTLASERVQGKQQAPSPAPSITRKEFHHAPHTATPVDLDRDDALWPRLGLERQD